MRFKYFWLSLQACFFSLCAFATPDLSSNKTINPHHIFTKMTQAIDTLSYQGTVVILKNGKLDTIKYSHFVKNGEHQERLAALNSSLKEVIRTSNKNMHVFNSPESTIIDHHSVWRSFFMNLPSKMEVVDENYDFFLEGEAHVAMLPVWVLIIQPKDNFRYQRKIWIDKKNNLPLRFELLDDNKKVLEQAIFVDIKIEEALPLVEISVADKSNNKHTHKLDVLPFATSKFIINNIPAGFYEVFFTHRAMRNSSGLVEHLLLGDGFSLVSVYFEQSNNNLKSNLTTVGAINSYTRQIGDYSFTVLGKVPIKTIRLIANNIGMRSL